MDLLKATSFALFLDTSYGHSWLSHKKGYWSESLLRLLYPTHQWPDDGSFELEKLPYLKKELFECSHPKQLSYPIETIL